MALKTGTVVFQDYKGKFASVKITGALSRSAMETFAKALANYTRAKIISASYAETTFFDNFQQLDFGDALSGQATEHFDRCEQKAKMIFRDADTGRMHIISLPAPNDNVFDAHQEVKATVAEDIADAIAAATSMESNDLQYRGGALVGKLPSIRQSQYAGV